ncbi:MAG: hypothetical protein AAF734_08875 [Bacteroidota bacterium]
MEESTVKLEITLKEANIIFKALGKLPFNEVYELIGKLNNQANTQLRQRNEKDINEGGNYTDESNI